MLNTLITTRKLTASAVVHIWPAHSVGDDLEVYADESRSQVVGRFHGLRQQSQVRQQRVSERERERERERHKGVLF